MKKTFLLLTTLVLAVISGIIFIQVIILIVGDVLGGALTGKPETGWGMLTSLFLIPIASIPGLLSVISYKFYRRNGGKYRWLVLATSILMSVIVFILIIVVQNRPADLGSSADAATVSALRNEYDAIDSYFYKHKGVLPDSTLTQASSEKGVTYRITDNDSKIFEICGKFDEDTTRPIREDENKPPYETAGQKVLKGEVLEQTDAMGNPFTIHKVGIQCYSIKLISPITNSN